MRTRRLTILSAALLAAGAAQAQAQTNVEVFGILDANVTRLTASGAGSVVTQGTDGNLSSRLGFRGTENLGGGMSASFWFEGAVNVDSGTGGSTSLTNIANATPSGGLTFGRRSTVSLSGERWGEIRLGRDYVPGFWNLSVFSAFGTNGVGNSGYLFYPVPGAARITNVRASNSIGYHLPRGLGGVYGQVMYSPGENPSNAGVTADDGKVAGLRLGFAQGPFDIAAATTKTKISSLGDLTQTNIGASYDFGVAKAMLLWGQNKTGPNKVNITMVGGRIPAGPGEIRLTFASASATGVANDARHFAAGYVYNLSKRSALYAHYGRISNKTGTAYGLDLKPTESGGTSTGIELGIRHSF